MTNRAYSGTHSPYRFKAAMFKWFMAAKLTMIAVVAAVFYAGGEHFIEHMVMSVPWQLSGLTFLITTLVVALPAMVLFFGILGYGMYREAHRL